MLARHRGESFPEHLAGLGVSRAVLDTWGNGFLLIRGILGRVAVAPEHLAACPRALADTAQHGYHGTEWNTLCEWSPFVTRGDMGAGSDEVTPECLVHATGQDVPELCCEEPHTAGSFVADPQLFQGATPAAGLAARLRDSLTQSFSEASAIPVASALVARP